MPEKLELGIQSYTLRSIRPMQLAKAIRQIGLTHVELWPDHLHYKWPDEKIDAVRSTFVAEKISISGYGAVFYDNDLEHNQRVFQFAKRLGLQSIMTVDLAPEQFSSIAKLCDEFEMKVSLHNHGKGFRWATLEEMQRGVKRASSNFGVCLDTAWCLDVGEDPKVWAQAFADQLLGVHLKDFSYKNGERHDAIVGTGNLDLPGFLKTLHQISFTGSLSMEYEGNEFDPVPDATECAKMIRLALQNV